MIANVQIGGEVHSVRSTRIGASGIAALLLACALLVLAGCSSQTVRAQRYFDSGKRYFDQQKYSEAAIQLQKAVKNDAGRWDTHYYLGLSDLKLQLYPEASRELGIAAELNPSYSPVKLDIADLLLLGGDTKEARKQVDAAEQLQGPTVRSRGTLARISVLEKDFQTAIKLWDEVHVLAPDDALGWTASGVSRIQLGQYGLAENDFHRALGLSPYSVEAYRNLANLYQLKGENREAERVLNEGLVKLPDSLSMNFVLADFYYRHGRQDDVEALFERLEKKSPPIADLHVQIGDFWIWRNELRRGTAQLEAERANHPSDLIDKKLVSAYISLNQVADAKALNERLLKNNPKDGDARAFDGALAYLGRDYGRAIQELQALLKEQPNSLVANYYLGMSWLGLHRPDRAKQAFYDCVRLNADFTNAYEQLGQLALRAKDWQEAAEYGNKLAQLAPASPAAYVLIAQSSLGNHDIRSADAALAKLKELQKSPSTEFYELAARLATYRHLTAVAKQDIEMAISLSPDPIATLVRYSSFQAEVGHTSEAIEIMKTWVAANPRSAEAFEVIARLYLSMGRVVDSETACSRALEIDSSRSTPHLLLAEIWQQKNRPLEALNEYDEAIRRSPRTIAPYVLAGDLLMTQGQYEKAKTYYDSAHQENPDSPVVEHAIARWNAERGQNLDVTLSVLQELKKQFPQDNSVSDTLGWVYYQKRLYSLAVQQLGPASAALSNSATAQFHLGMTCYQLGEKDRAKRALRRALELGLAPVVVPDAERVLDQLNHG